MQAWVGGSPVTTDALGWYEGANAACLAALFVSVVVGIWPLVLVVAASWSGVLVYGARFNRRGAVRAST